MSEYTEYDFSLTIEQLQKLVKDGMKITVIINGMYYTLKDDGENEN